MQHYGLTVDTAPAEEPVTLGEAKTHLRVDIAADDDYINALIEVARERVEDETQRKLITQTLKMTLDRFPSSASFFPHRTHHSHDHDPAIRLPRSPVQSVESIEYIDDVGDLQTLDSSKFDVDLNSLVPRIVPAFNEEWPDTQAVINAVTIKFVAGYGDTSDDVPKRATQAMLLIIGTYYDPVRATVVVGSTAAKLPDAAEALLGTLRVGTVGGSY